MRTLTLGSRGCTVVVLALLAGAWTATPAAAQEGWRLASTVGGPFRESPSRETPHVAVDAAGNAIAVWRRPGDAGVSIEWSRLDVTTNSWSAAAPLAVAASVTGVYTDPLVAMTDAGDAVAVWREALPGGSLELVWARWLAGATQWDSPRRLSDAGPIGDFAFALGALGHGMLLWIDGSSPFTPVLRARRYAIGSDEWGPVQMPAGATVASSPAVAVNRAGHAVGLWAGSGVRGARFDPDANSWSTPALVLPAIGPLRPPAVALNDAGDAVAASIVEGIVFAARTGAGGGWEPAATFDVLTGDNQQSPSATIDPAGNATIAWSHRFPDSPTHVRAARHAAGDGAWSAPVELAAAADGFDYPVVRADASGNVFAVWSSRPAGAARLQSARWIAGEDRWVAWPDVTPPIPHVTGLQPQLAVDGRGQAVVVFRGSADPYIDVSAARWLATPHVPTVTAIDPAPGTLSVSFTLTPARESSLAAHTIEYSVDGGATWAIRATGAAASPLAITGLQDGTVYALRIRAANAAGRSPATDPLLVRSGSGAAPTHFRVAATSGQLLTFAWVPPQAGVVPVRYVIEGGFAGSRQVAAAIPVGAVTQATFAVPSGRFFVRVVAITALSVSTPSNEITIATGDTAPPEAPTHVLASTTGNTFALSWTQPLESGTPTETRLFGSGRTFQSVTLPPTETVSFPAAARSGIVQVFVSAANAGGQSPLSPAVTLDAISRCSGPPSPPLAFSASTDGRVVYLDWLPPASGEAVTHYVVAVSGAFSGAFPMASRTLAVPVAPGSYTVRVSAAGLCGTSAPTAPQTVVLP